MRRHLFWEHAWEWKIYICIVSHPAPPEQITGNQNRLRGKGKEGILDFFPPAQYLEERVMYLPCSFRPKVKILVNSSPARKKKLRAACIRIIPLNRAHPPDE